MTKKTARCRWFGLFVVWPALVCIAAAPDKSPKTIEVKPGQSIQKALDQAGRGDRVRVYPGVYPESLRMTQPEITLEGVVQGAERAVLDGQGALPKAIDIQGDRITVQGMAIRDYQKHGATARGARDVVFRDLIIQKPGVVGLSPIECDRVLIQRCEVSGAKNAALHVRQSRNVVMRANEVFQNAAGIVIENCVDALLENNFAHDNAAGILLCSLPDSLPAGEKCRLAENRVFNNNAPNTAEPESFLANLMPGTGILILAADRAIVTRNIVRGNHSFGIAILARTTLVPSNAPAALDANPDETLVFGNRLRENGSAPDERLAKKGLPGRDLLWDGSGKGNAWEQPGATSFPEKLPERTNGKAVGNRQ